MLTKQQFMAAANAIISQLATDDKITESLKIFCHDSYPFYTTGLIVPMIDLLRAASGDEDQWLSYWLFDLEQGAKHKRGTVKIDGKGFKLKTLDDVWKIIKKQERKHVD